MYYYFAPAKARFYRIVLQSTLFGTTDVICSWGSTQNKRGGKKVFPTNNSQELEQKVAAIHKRRVSRGYQIIT